MNRSQRLVAIVVLALVAASLGLLWHSVRLRQQVSHIAAMRQVNIGGVDHLALAFDGALHVLDAQGQRRQRVPLAAMSLNGQPTDLEARP